LGWGEMDWIDLAQAKNRWRALVNVVMQLRVPKMWGITWLAENWLAFQEGLCPMEWVSELISDAEIYEIKDVRKIFFISLRYS
jgi:hypothetical protein